MGAAPGTSLLGRTRNPVKGWMRSFCYWLDASGPKCGGRCQVQLRGGAVPAHAAAARDVDLDEELDAGVELDEELDAGAHTHTRALPPPYSAQSRME